MQSYISIILYVLYLTTFEGADAYLLLPTILEKSSVNSEIGSFHLIKISFYRYMILIKWHKV